MDAAVGVLLDGQLMDDVDALVVLCESGCGEKVDSEDCIGWRGFEN